MVEELIKNEKVTFMSHLHSKFVKIVQRVEGLDARDFRKFRLKERLIHSYPQLVFVTPKRRDVSEIVFAENLCPSDIMQDDYGLDEYDLSGGSGYDNDHFLDADTDANEPLVEAHALYHASMLLKGTISDEARNALEGTDISARKRMSSHKVARKSLTFHLSCVKCGRLDIFLTGQVTTYCCVKKSIPRMSKVTYLPVIDASAIELSTSSKKFKNC